MSLLERNELLRTVKRLGRTIWKKWSGYHRRSLVETKMHCIKLLGINSVREIFKAKSMRFMHVWQYEPYRVCRRLLFKLST